jgi:hypothetical protein
LQLRGDLLDWLAKEQLHMQDENPITSNAGLGQAIADTTAISEPKATVDTTPGSVTHTGLQQAYVQSQEQPDVLVPSVPRAYLPYAPSAPVFTSVSTGPNEFEIHINGESVSEMRLDPRDAALVLKWLRSVKQ